MFLRHQSLRPQLLVDNQGRRSTEVGVAEWLGRQRVVSALKLDNNPPPPNWPARGVVSEQDFLVLDPTDDSVVGVTRRPRIIRWLRAERAPNTRRL